MHDAQDYPALFAEHFDNIPYHGRRTDKAFYVERAAACGGPVLEVACGTGRILIPCAEAGADITGIDACANMLGRCREKVAALPEAVRRRIALVDEDMRAVNLTRRFALITIPFNTFLLMVSVEDQLRCLRRLRGQLREGGRLILDMFDPDLKRLCTPVEELPLQSDDTATLADGRVVKRAVRVVARDAGQQTQTAVFDLRVTHPDGAVETGEHRLVIRWVYRYELEHLLARAGFAVERVYSDFEGTPFGTGEPNSIVVEARGA
jgi:SAM-dependent methyltransferase